MKKLECKHCKSTSQLHEMTHPAGWKYILCLKHAEIQEKGFHIDEVTIEGNQVNVDLTVKIANEKYCTCITAPNPSSCVVHGRMNHPE